jgi:hypothetical protein
MSKESEGNKLEAAAVGKSLEEKHQQHHHLRSEKFFLNK